ncbi:MAG: HEAT repeat domain-containing protein [Planctomycetaceae bacterium]|nr:HEAT repeat domain-containing protein [Planctomycetaceae bacterium]
MAFLSADLCAQDPDGTDGESAPAASVSPRSFDGIRVPSGFRADLYADDDLAHDIHSLTINSDGQIVVSGPGYIRVLLDNDLDGQADAYRQVLDGPAVGSQGMFWLGSNLLFAGDEGLQIVRDADNDGIADGPPTTFLRISSGGEHHVHSIQKGPDGWWYVIAGNFAGVTDSYASLPTSPIRHPLNGTILRFRPDLSGAEVVADGFRNAYDFAFGPGGELYTFDSDDERDVTLPWYQPTRVFQVPPMSNSGWVSEGWKRPTSFPDMPPVIADFGRGSPTGVVCYQSPEFPAEWQNALFVLDWTMGRILAVPCQPEGSCWKGQPYEFAAGQNQFGFAPTDLEVGPDGCLYVSVGGRGTRGGVYRISWTGDTTAEQPFPDRSPAVQTGLVTTEDTDAGAQAIPIQSSSVTALRAPAAPVSRQEELTTAQRLDRVLDAPQPLSAWSRRIWMPEATRLGRDAFRAAALDEQRTTRQRIRAIEILTELHSGMDSATALRLINSPAWEIRARTAWAVGRTRPESPDAAILRPLAKDSAPHVRRMALEALCTTTGNRTLDAMIPEIAAALGDRDRHVRMAAAVLIHRMTEEQRLILKSRVTGHPVATLWMLMGQQLRETSVNPEAAQFAAAVLSSPKATPELRYDAVRTLQLALSDVGPVAHRPATFHSYGPQLSLNNYDLELNPVRAALAGLFPTGDADLDRELIRVIAMTSPLNRDLFSTILAGIIPESHPTDDLHRLAALAQFDLERSYDETTAIARALVAIDVKVHQAGLRQDTNWDDRIGELYEALCRVDPVLPQLVAEQPDLGLPGHVTLLEKAPQGVMAKAIASFAARIEKDPDYEWNNDVVFLLAESDLPEHRRLLREQLENYAVRDAVLIVLADRPERDDRELFLSGLESTQLNAVDASIKALTRLPRSNAAEEQFLLLAAAKRLINSEREFRIRNTVMRLLQNNTGQSLGYDFSDEGLIPQPAAMTSWQLWLQKRYPEFQPANVEDSAARVLEMLPAVRWETGDAIRGKKAFERLNCARCHNGRQALGPDLAGVARRFSREDLFVAIVDPNRDISNRYQTTTVLTKDGKLFSGLIVYQSVDGILLRDAEHKTYRIEGADIESRQQQRTSLMPAGLLKDTTDQDLADLYEYLLQQ